MSGIAAQDLCQVSPISTIEYLSDKCGSAVLPANRQNKGLQPATA